MKSLGKRQIEWQGIEPNLQVADIILVRDNEAPLSKVIRKSTNSYWSHVAMVFFVPDKELSFDNILLIGAEHRGIEIHRIQRYTHNLDRLDIGVKRIPGLPLKTRERVVSYVLNNIDIPYDFARLFGFFFRYLFTQLRKKHQDPEHIKKFLINRDTFICSTFIQKAFFEAVPQEKRHAVMFNKELPTPLALEEVTPADIARSSTCQWLYNPHD